MIRSLCTTGSLALVMTLTACQSLPTKEKTATPQQALNIFTPSTSDSLSDRMKADSLFIEGDVYAREGKTARAIEIFEKVALLDTTSPYIHIRLAAEYFKLNQDTKAISHAEKALQKDPKNVEAFLLLGGLYSADKKYDLAIAQYNKALELQPGDVEAPLYLGSIYTELKDYKKAEQFFKMLLKNPDYKTPHLVHYNMGLMHASQSGARAQAAAEVQFKKALSLRPWHTDSVLSLATIYLEQKNPDKALSLALDFQEHQHFSSSVADLIAEIYVKKGQSEKALEQFEFISENSNPTLESQMKMTLLLIEQKQFARAAAKLKAIVAKYPSADGARYYLAAVQEQNGDLDSAIRNYMAVSAKSEHFSQAVVHAAYLLKGMGKINQALVVTEKGLKTNADKPQVYTMHASLLGAKADYLGAARTLEQGLTKHSQNVELLFQYALAMDRLGKKEEMMAQMRKVLDVEPDHVESLSYLAFSMAELNRHLPEAEKMARRALELQPKDAYVMDTLGWVLFKQNKISDSIKILEQAYQAQSTDSVIAEHLALAYAKHDLTEKAQVMHQIAAALKSTK